MTLKPVYSLCTYGLSLAQQQLFVCQAQDKTVAQADKSWTDIPGVPPPVRLVVNATSESQISSNPIISAEGAPGLAAWHSTHLCSGTRQSCLTAVPHDAH